MSNETFSLMLWGGPYPDIEIHSWLDLLLILIVIPRIICLCWATFMIFLTLLGLCGLCCGLCCEKLINFGLGACVWLNALDPLQVFATRTAESASRQDSA